MARIYFVGICCYVEEPPGSGNRVIVLPNVGMGGAYAEHEIPAHNAFIDVVSASAETTNWTPWLSGNGRHFYQLEGVRLSFNPAPDPVAALDLSLLKRVHAPDFCLNAEVLRDGYIGNSDPEKAAALIEVTGGPIEALTVGRGAVVTLLTVPSSPASPLTITATSFDRKTIRSLRIIGDDTAVYICNVFFMDWFVGTSTSDDFHHKYLYCSMFEPADLPAGRRMTRLNLTSFMHVVGAPLSTLGAGCSNTQFP